MRKLLMSVALSALATGAFADDVALLFGTERYTELRRVVNAADILGAADPLRNAGYDVEALANAQGGDMAASLRRFAIDAQDADRIVVALTGRFVTDGQRSWYLAADARQPTLFGMDDRAISLDNIMAVMANAPGQAVLVLGLDDRDGSDIDTYLRQGIGALDVPQGVTVVFGEPRYVDDMITDAIVVRNGNVMDYVRDTRRLTAEGYQPDRLVLQQNAATTAPVVTPRADPAIAAWSEAQQADSAAAYRDFALRYPNNANAAEARARLDEIENDPVRIARLAEEELRLNRNARRDVQRDLTLLGYNTRGVDGIFGPGSRNAIRNWQQSNGFAQSSFLDREQISRIDAQASRRQAEIDAEAARKKAEEGRIERAYWEETGNRGDAAGYRAYLDRYPQGIFAEEATNKLNQSRGGDAAQAEERAMGLNPILARLIESRLDQLGYGPGQVDGQFDRNTRSAIGRYQQDRSLPATGYMNEPTAARLLAEALSGR